jgi:hypothetical protein
MLLNRRASKLKINKAMSKDNWATMMWKTNTLQSQGKELHLQPYIPSFGGCHAVEPFILIIQDQWMFDICLCDSLKQMCEL